MSKYYHISDLITSKKMFPNSASDYVNHYFVCNWVHNSEKHAREQLSVKWFVGV